MISDFDRDLGARIRAERLARGISQHAFAAAVGTSGPNLCAYECGRRTMNAYQLDRIVRALGCPLAQILPPVAG